MNPTYKEFMEKHPDKTVIGMAWAFYWRIVVLIIGLEIALMIIFFVFGIIFGR